MIIWLNFLDSSIKIVKKKRKITFTLCSTDNTHYFHDIFFFSFHIFIILFCHLVVKMVQYLNSYQCLIKGFLTNSWKNPLFTTLDFQILLLSKGIILISKLKTKMKFVLLSNEQGGKAFFFLFTKFD